MKQFTQFFHDIVQLSWNSESGIIPRLRYVKEWVKKTGHSLAYIVIAVLTLSYSPKASSKVNHNHGYHYREEFTMPRMKLLLWNCVYWFWTVIFCTIDIFTYLFSMSFIRVAEEGMNIRSFQLQKESSLILNQQWT